MFWNITMKFFLQLKLNPSILIMMNYYLFIFFIPMNFISNLLCLFSKSYFSLWMIMELNLISFIMIIYSNLNSSYENMILYFFIQSINSMMILLFILLILYKNLNFINYMILICLMMKLGNPPFYNWYLKLFNSMNWISLIYLSIFQKFIPLYIMNLMMNNFNNKMINMIMLIILLFMLFLSIMGMNQTNIKLIFSYSSMIQILWVMIFMLINESMSMIYFLIYSIININLFIMFNKFKIFNMNDLINMKMMNKYFKMNLLMLILSISGIPPMMGFLMKWMSLYYLQNYFSFFLLLLMIFSSIINMIFYFRLFYIKFMNFMYINKLNIKSLKFNYINYNNYLILWFNMFMLFMYEMI